MIKMIIIIKLLQRKVIETYQQQNCFNGDSCNDENGRELKSMASYLLVTHQKLWISRDKNKEMDKRANFKMFLFYY